MAGSALPILAATVRDFLQRFAPFNEMDRAALDLIAAGARLGYVPRGEEVIGPQRGIVRTLFIVQRGTVISERDPTESGGPEGTVVVQEFSAGDVFPIPAIMGGHPARVRYVAAEDVFCYEIDGAVFEELIQRSLPFRRFCTRQMGSLLQQLTDRVRQVYAQRAAPEHSMMMPIGQLVTREPVVCRMESPAREALRLMQANKVGSIVIISDRGEPTGIFTERDLLRHTADGSFLPDQPIGRFMTPDPVFLPSTATASEAALTMVRRGIRHMVVVEGERLAGVVSERSLFAFQRLSMREVSKAIEIAQDQAALIRAAGDIRRLAQSMLAQGIAAEQLTQFIALLNDRLTERAIQIEVSRHRLDGSRWCWLALGSEGRLEQTLATDQDNAIVFVHDGSPGEARDALLPFARAVNALLDACGFPLCNGNVMAGNPECCLSIEEWKARFSDWVRNPSPQALLNATIFFDFRGLAGDLPLAGELRNWLRDLALGDERFFHTLAADALRARPPLGFFRSIVTSSDSDHMVDLKSQGTRVFVDAARLYALKTGVEHTSTAMRLRESGKRLGIPGTELEALIEAFHYQLMLRLRQQHLDAPHAEALGTGNNRIDPDRLNDLDRRILRESFLQARRLQQRLAMDYQL